ncbi:unnamed protein product, partial [Ascophyllum nodosum]
FIENISGLDGGPAVSNIGYVSNVTTSYFHDNVFNCENQMFLSFNKSIDLFETVCNGCPDVCAGCSFGQEQRSPTCTYLSEAGVEHATSEGGATTLWEIRIHEGYWRSTNTSTDVYECFNTKACAGGLTGASNFCLSGYEGPYCSVCSKNYVST